MVIISLILGVFNTFLVKLGLYYGRVLIIFLREVLFFFFFLISKNVIYTKGYSMHKEHRANPEDTRRRKQRKNKKKKTNQQINYKEKES